MLASIALYPMTAAQLNSLIADNLSSTSFDVKLLARLMHMSRPTLYRKINAIAPLTPNELINTARLDKAAGLLASSDHTVAEIAAMAGFHSRSNFGQAFLKRYKMTPKEFKKQHAHLMGGHVSISIR